MFAPKPRDYSYTLNKKVKRLALKSALSAKAASGDILVVDGLKLDEIKTKTMRDFLNAIEAGKSVVITPEVDQAVSYTHLDVYKRQVWERATSEMGDPAEIGKALARLHKPWLGYLWRASMFQDTPAAPVPAYAAHSHGD